MRSMRGRAASPPCRRELPHSFGSFTGRSVGSLSSTSSSRSTSTSTQLRQKSSSFLVTAMEIRLPNTLGSRRKETQPGMSGELSRRL